MAAPLEQLTHQELSVMIEMTKGAQMRGTETARAVIELEDKLIRMQNALTPAPEPVTAEPA